MLMGMGGEPDAADKARLDKFFDKDESNVGDAKPVPTVSPAPPRPTRDVRHLASGNSAPEPVPVGVSFSQNDHATRRLTFFLFSPHQIENSSTG